MSTWHATARELEAFRSGSADPLLVASVETHLIRCEQCRRQLAALDLPGPAADTERRWQSISRALDTEQVRRSGALLWAGAATLPLATALLVAVLLVLGLPLLASLAGAQSVPLTLLIAAPLAPLVAVAFAYRPETEPAGELAGALPVAGIRLVTQRALLVAGIAVPVGILGALALDVPLSAALAWLLPGLAMSALVLLAGTTRLDPMIATLVLGLGWTTAISMTARREHAAVVIDAVASLPVQGLCLAVAVGAALLVLLRQDRVSYRRSL